MLQRNHAVSVGLGELCAVSSGFPFSLSFSAGLWCCLVLRCRLRLTVSLYLAAQQRHQISCHLLDGAS